MKCLLNLLRFRSWLRPTEQIVLTAVENNLAPEPKLILRRQIEEINYVQRHFDGKEVNMYHLEGGHVCPPANTCFPNKSEELILARVTLARRDSDRRMTAFVWLVRGRLFSITFDAPPGRDSSGLPAFSCEILADAMRNPTTSLSSLPIVASTKDTLLSRLRETLGLVGIVGPAGNAEFNRFVQIWGTSVPDDHLLLIRETNGFAVQEWTFLGTGVRLIVSRETNWLVLAEHARGALCTPESSADNGVYFCDFETSDFSFLTTSFLAALVDAARNSRWVD